MLMDPPPHIGSITMSPGSGLANLITPIEIHLICLNTMVELFTYYLTNPYAIVDLKVVGPK